MTAEEYVKVYKENKKFMDRVGHVADLVGLLPDPMEDNCPILFGWILGNVWIGPDGTVEACYDPDDNSAYNHGYGCPAIRFPKEFLDDSMSDEQIVKKAKKLGIYKQEPEED